jgi:hypothetical protein
MFGADRMTDRHQPSRCQNRRDRQDGDSRSVRACGFAALDHTQWRLLSHILFQPREDLMSARRE